MDVLEWADENLRDFPWREPDRSLYEVFIAEFFLTQTPAENVSTVYPEFLERFPSLEAIDEASEDELVDTIKPLGFYNMRSNALKRIAAENETLPDTTKELVKLTRVGRYVTNATLCFARDEPLPVLDRNVERVYSRVFSDDWPQSSTEQLQFAERLVPKDRARLYNLTLLDFGAAICTPQPSCDECFANEYCTYYQDS